MEKQISFVIKELRKKGKISRNQCLSKNITRLGAIIAELKNDKWKFDERPSRTGKTMIQGRYEKTRFGRDYVYEVVYAPKIKK